METIRQAWLYNKEDKQVAYANNARQVQDLTELGWRITDEAYAMYWLLDNGYTYVTPPQPPTF